MRITSGKYRGRKIYLHEQKGVRPTSAMSREAIFNIISHGEFSVTGKNVLDIFCGTGALGLEALSRGAASATFLDKQGSVLRLVQHNIESLKIEEPTKTIKADAMKLEQAPQQYDIAFLDPPYFKGMIPKTLKNIAAHNWLKKGSLVVIEYAIKEEVKLPEKYEILKSKNYSGTKIEVARYNG